MTSVPLISVVSPVYGCRECLIELTKRVSSGFEDSGLEWELVLVDDRGPDDSWSLIQQLATDDARIRGIKLARNYGQHLAIWTGLEAAKGEWVAVIDCDLQDDPRAISELHARATEAGVDAVIVDRGEWVDTRLRRVASNLYNRILSWLIGIKIDRNVGNFGIYSRRMVNVLLQFREKEVFLPIMVLLTGLPRIVYILNRSEREVGKSSYNLFRLVQMAVSIIIRFSDRPLRLSVSVGLSFSVLAAVVSLLLFLAWMTDMFSVPGWTSIILSTWFLSGIILSVLGIHGIYLGRIFREVQNRPRILIESTTETAKK